MRLPGLAAWYSPLLRHAPWQLGAWLVLSLGIVPAGGGPGQALAQDAAADQGLARPEERFHNTQNTGPQGSVLRWQWERWRDGLPKPPGPGFPPPVLHPDLEAYRAIAQRGTQPGAPDDPVPVVWIGHATFLLSIGGVNILTDPQFSQRASPLSFLGPKRRVPPALTLAELPHIEAVIISHNHYDHLDVASVQALQAQPGGPPRFFVPLGLKAWFADLGIANVVELGWWQTSAYRGLNFTLVPAQHFSGRTLTDGNQTLWGGWIVEHPDFRFHFAGDTGYSADFKEIGRRFAPIDLTALPIGAYEPRWFMHAMHVNPEEAVRILLDLGAIQAVAMHWGTFQLTDEPLDEPPKALAAALAAAHVDPARFLVLRPGEMRQFPARPAPVALAAPQAVRTR